MTYYSILIFCKYIDRFIPIECYLYSSMQVVSIALMYDSNPFRVFELFSVFFVNIILKSISWNFLKIGIVMYLPFMKNVF